MQFEITIAENVEAVVGCEAKVSGTSAIWITPVEIEEDLDGGVKWDK